MQEVSLAGLHSNAEQGDLAKPDVGYTGCACPIAALGLEFHKAICKDKTVQPRTFVNLLCVYSALSHEGLCLRRSSLLSAL